MEIKYQLTRSEYQNMAANDTARHPKVRSRRTFFLLYISVVSFILAYMLIQSFLPAFLAAALGFAVAGPAFHSLRKRGFGTVYDMLAPKEESVVRLDAVGMYVAREHIRSEIDWEAITHLAEDEVGFYLTFGPLQTVYVPRRVFASAAEAQQFWTLAQEYRQFAKTTSKVPVRI